MSGSVFVCFVLHIFRVHYMMLSMAYPVFKDGYGKDVHVPFLDQSLLLRAERLSNGANGHDIACKMSQYKYAVHIAQEAPSVFRYLRAYAYKETLSILLIAEELGISESEAIGRFYDQKRKDRLAKEKQ